MTLLKGTKEDIVIPKDAELALDLNSRALTNEDAVIPKEAALTLDLNGKTLTNVSGHTITNNGTLIITGDGTVDNVTHGKAAIQNEPGGIVVLNGGAYTRSKENGNDDADSGGNSYYNIVNHGTMEINNGVSVTQTGHFSSMIENGWYKGSENTGGQNSVLTINGGTFSGGLNTIKNDDYGELTINDGTFTSMSQAAFLNWNIATVNGGTFNAESASSGVILNGYLDDSMDQGELTINGGTFNAGEQNAVIATMNGAHSGDIEITGGTLNGSIVLTDNKGGAQLTITQDAKINGNVTNRGKADVAITDGATVSGQVSNDTNGTMSVVNSTVGSVPQDTTSDSIVIVNSYVDNVLTTNTRDKAIVVGGKTYDTMAKAIEAVGDGQTIYVLKDIPDAVGIAVPSSKNFTIDFGGHTYTLIGPGAGSSGTETNGFQLLKGSTITFKNGTIRIAENANDIKRIIQNYANLTLEDMHIYAENQVPDENYALSFNNGNITFKGDTDVITTSDETIAFDVCKFASYLSASVTFDESYTGTVNGRIVYDSTNADTHKLVIQGDGTFGTIEAANGAENAAKAGIEVTSGHFAEPVNEDYLADSVKARLESASNPEAPYSYYPSVEDAIAAAKPGDTVTAVNTEPGKTTYTVTLKFNDGRTDDLTYKVSEDTAIDLPTPRRSGYTFEGWYDGNTRVSDPYNVTKTVTLTAEWDYKDDDHGSSSSGSSSSVRRYNIEADAGRGGDISPDGRVRVRRGENQTFRITADDGWEIADVEVDGESVGAVERYTFENVRTDHTISVTFRQIVTEPEEPQTPALPFTDVSEGDWYHDAVAYCWENGIMDGTSGTAFAPNMILTRAMMAQVLYNLADGTASTVAGFPDVAASAWYADAVNWAAANGYVTGYDNGSYGPEDSLTREQLAVILYRYAGSPAPAGTLDSFADAASASDYAVDALRWAVGEGLLTGKDGGRLDPTGTASRAELAQILARFAQM
ncbi:S-layer homology domain-containing protein [Flavonifractor sp. An10]|uniref:S-layer homology domain-containing protein n=1 Tax=Flavonifractor sp. An10 TaxID=1965537 RepID=UPI001FA92B09|nr:S-layer homology domain-containing protein [Flavonifractor sp. An10]